MNQNVRLYILPRRLVSLSLFLGQDGEERHVRIVLVTD
jgi:hypothetical protein